MANAFIGEVRAMPYEFVPQGWAPCQGQLLQTTSNAALFINPYNGDQKLNNLLIEGNWLNGGNYTIYVLGNSTNVVIRNNFFGRNYRYGVKSIYAPNVVWENNRWMDDNTLIP